MKQVTNIGLTEVQRVYSGVEGELWGLIMGQQIHIGGFRSSLDLAQRASIQPGWSGIDLCCCHGAGMRFLLRFFQVASMHGVDATAAVIQQGQQRCQAEGLSDQIEFTMADACQTGLPDGSFDFVWGEDAWCYVVDKRQLIAEAARLVKPGGIIAFTDWIEGSQPLTEDEAVRLLRFMKFPSIQDLQGYTELLSEHGCEVLVAEDTGRFAPHVDLYLNMLNMQLTYDALQILDFDNVGLKAMADEMVGLQQLAHAGKIAQGIFVARRKT